MLQRPCFRLCYLRMTVFKGTTLQNAVQGGGAGTVSRWNVSTTWNVRRLFVHHSLTLPLDVSHFAFCSTRSCTSRRSLDPARSVGADQVSSVGDSSITQIDWIPVWPFWSIRVEIWRVRNACTAHKRLINNPHLRHFSLKNQVLYCNTSFLFLNPILCSRQCLVTPPPHVIVRRRTKRPTNVVLTYGETYGKIPRNAN